MTSAYTIPAEAASWLMDPPREILFQCAPPSRVDLSAGPYSHPFWLLANTTPVTFEGAVPRPGFGSLTSGALRKCQCAPLSVVATSRALHARPTRQPTAPSTTPEAGERKLAAAGRKRASPRSAASRRRVAGTLSSAIPCARPPAATAAAAPPPLPPIPLPPT